MTHTLRTAILSLALVVVIGLTTAHAVTADRWSHYRERKTGNVIVVKSDCLAAEDSAAHLKLLDYSSDRIVYGCYRKGY